MQRIKIFLFGLLPSLFVLAACHSVSSDRLASAKLEQYHGRTVYNINGKPYYPMLYSSEFTILRSPYTRDGKINYTNFTNAGINLFETHIELRNAWNKDGSLNKAIVEYELISTLRGIHAINPDAYFQIRFDIHAPHWWLEKYPEELVQYARGPIDFSTYNDIVRAPNASIASERWHKDATDILNQFFDYLQTTDVKSRIFSFMPSGGCGSEWHYFGYKQEADTGEAMTKRFRQWLSEKYLSDAALQQAWGDKQVTLAAVTIPDLVERRYNTGVFRDPQKERRIIDYFHCMQETVEKSICYWTKHVKTTWPGDVLVGIFNGYLFSDNDFNANGHLYFDRLLDNPYIDFFAAPFNYNTDTRELGGAGQPRSLVESVRLHGKLWMTEQDRILHRLEGRTTEPAPLNDEEAIAMIRTCYAQLLCRATGYWMEEFSGFPGYPPFLAHQPKYDTAGNWNTPMLMNEVKHHKSFCDRVMEDEYESVADVAFIYDFNTYYYMAETDNRQTREIQYASNNWMTSDAYRSGAAFDTYLLSDLPLIDISKYKVFVFGTTYCMSDEQMDFINKNIKKDGRMVIFNYAPAYTDGEKLDIDRIKALTEVNIRPFSLNVPPQLTVNGKDYGLTCSGVPGIATVSPLFAADDKDAEVLGVYKDTNTPAIVKKQQDGYTTVYAALPLRDSDLMRRLFQEAGVHIYNDANDVVIAGSGAVCVATKPGMGGKKNISLRNGKKVDLDIRSASTVIIDARTGEYLFE